MAPLAHQIREFVIDIGLVADMAIINPFDFFLEESAQQFPFQDFHKAPLIPEAEKQAHEILTKQCLSCHMPEENVTWCSCISGIRAQAYGVARLGDERLTTRARKAAGG